MQLSLLTVFLLPWWIGHGLEEFMDAKPLLETTVVLVHFLSYLIPLSLGWMLREYRPDKVFRIVLIVVVLGLMMNTWNVIHASRHFAAELATQRAQEAFAWAGDQLNNPTRKTADIVVLDQAIAKMVEQIYVMVRDDFPELKLRNVSLHMVLPSRFPTETWNVIQAGSEKKTVEFLPKYRAETTNMPGSLAASAIIDIEHRRKYCDDVTRVDKTPWDCKDFSFATSAEYKSIVCFSLDIGDWNTPRFAAICFDGDNAYPWHYRLDKLYRKLSTKPSVLNMLGQLLEKYRNEENLLFKVAGPYGATQ